MDKNYLSHGPFPGNITQNQVTVWFRSAKGIKETFVLRLYTGKEEVDFREVTVYGINDFIGTVNFAGLVESTSYRAVVSLNEMAVGELVFKTKSLKRQTLHFVFGSCRYNHWHNVIQDDGKFGDRTFEQIKKLHDKSELDFLLFLGDQIYADPTLSVGVSQTFEDFGSTYREAFSLPHFHKLISNVQSYMILDDHEIRNNWSRDLLDSFSFFENREEIYQNGIKAYELWQHSRNPQTPDHQYWYTFEQNSWPFFVMDTRTQRLNLPRKGTRRTTLGDEQLGDLLEWLYETKKKPVRFIGSGIPFFPDNIKNEDKWSAFDEERNLILEFLRVEKIGKTVFLSGDVHIGMFASMSCVQDEGFSVYNFTSSPLYWPYRGMYVSDFCADKTLVYDQWQDQKRCRRGKYTYNYKASNWLRENQFCEVKVTENGDGSVRHFNMKENKFESPWYF